MKKLTCIIPQANSTWQRVGYGVLGFGIMTGTAGYMKNKWDSRDKGYKPVSPYTKMIMSSCFASVSTLGTLFLAVAIPVDIYESYIKNIRTMTNGCQIVRKTMGQTVKTSFFVVALVGCGYFALETADDARYAFNLSKNKWNSKIEIKHD
jgi:hypothetical protein